MSRWDVNVVLYRLKKDGAFRARFAANPRAALVDADLTDEERDAFVAWLRSPAHREVMFLPGFSHAGTAVFKLRRFSNTPRVERSAGSISSEMSSAAE